jgi:TolB-like protein/Tfp pilus assembly protein PilF
MSRFLRFVVEETAAGRADGLKEYVVGVHVFDKAESFDPAVDPTVRVEASKLRAKLARYYENEGRHDSLVIDVPKGHYAATFCVREPDAVSPPRTSAAAASTSASTGWMQLVDSPRERPAEAIESAVARPRATPCLRRAIGLAVVVMVVATGFVVFVRTRAGPAVATGGIMLAVLPFQNLTGDPGQDYLCDGLTEEMIAHLSAIDPVRLRVIARTSVMHYKGTTKRADEIGRELGARYLLETSLRRTGNRIRITAQLIDAPSQSHIWVEQYDRDAQNLLAVQADVAAAVARRTMSTWGLAARNSESHADWRSSNSLASEEYLRGRYHLGKRTAEGLQKAQEHFRKAIELDSTYARAYSGLADTYTLLGSYGILPIGESHPLGRQAALKALELDESLAEGHRSLAAITTDYYWDWADGDRHFRRAIELAPNDSTTLQSYAFYLAYTGRPVEALPIAEQACSLDPVSTSAQLNLGVIQYMARRLDEAVRQLERTLDLDRNVGFAHAALGLTYASKGDPERAVAELQKARSLAPTRPDIVAVHGYTLARAGRRADALATLSDIRRLTNPRSPPPFQMAVVYVGLKDWDRAFEWLNKAVETRAWEVPLLKADPAFDSLRSDHRFAPLLERVALPR